MKPKIWIDVDTQVDFCDPAGALSVPGAPAVMPAIRALVAGAVARKELLFASADSHAYTAWEFQANGGPFPAHCVKGTAGWLKMPGTLPERVVFVPNVARPDRAGALPEGLEGVVFEKEVYSLFANVEAEPVIDLLLARRGLGRAEVEAVVFGVATDYCVREAALGLRARGFDVAVATDAIAAITPAGEASARADLVRAGCRLATAAELAREALA